MMREFEIERQFNIKIEVIKANKGIYYLKNCIYDSGTNEILFCFQCLLHDDLC